jgi:hypothetical protein
MKRATGRDDPALLETTWPLPCEEMGLLQHDLYNGNPVSDCRGLGAAGILAACRALIEDGTTAGQTRKLAALRRVYRRSVKP